MASSHNNTISISCPDITNVTIDTSSIQITPGQPLDSAGVSHSSSGAWDITLICGRSGSADIAENYTRLASGSYHMFVQKYYSDNSATESNVPRNMNFLFKAVLFFGSHGVPLYFGQEGLDLVNYWWIGGPMILNNCPNASPIAYLVAPDASLYVVTFYNDEVDQINIARMTV